MQNQKPESTSKEDGNTNCNNCQYDHEDERLMWYERYKDYVSASEERYDKKIQCLRSSCRQQLRNLVVKLHKEYEVKVQKLNESYEKNVASQKSKYRKKITELENLLRGYEKDIKLYRSSEKTLVLSDSENEESDSSNIHEKCESAFQELQSLLGEKEEEILQIRQELQETNILLSEKQQESEYLNTQNNEDFQAKQKDLKSQSIQTEEVLYNQLQSMNKTTKMTSLKIENLEGLSIPGDSNTELVAERNDLLTTLASKDNTVKELQEKIDKLEVELEKSNNVNEDLHQRVKMLQKSFSPDQPPRKRDSNRSSYENIEHMKKIWEKKIMILQESMHTLRNEMYLRQNLEKQATMLHRAGISYTGRPDTPEETFQAKLLPSDQSMGDQLSAKYNTMLPVRQDINQELSALLAANGWWKQ